MNIFSTSGPQWVTPRRCADASASQLSETFCKLQHAFAVLFLTAFLLGGCGYAGTPPSPSVTILLQPSSAVVALGQTQQFQALVTGSGDTAVTWEVNGVANGNSISGTVSDAGLYTAPLMMPSPAGVTVTVVSQANRNDQASAGITLQDGIGIAVLPATATVEPGGAQVFTANISGAGGVTGGVTWSVNGVSGGNATVGTVVANGASSAVYSAPAVIPSPALVIVTAASVADPAKTGSAAVTIACANPNSIAPLTAQVDLGQAQTFTASFCGIGAAAIAWDVNGISGGSTALGTIVVTSATTASYTAPANLPGTNPVTIHAVAGGVGGATASATITIVSVVTVSISPPSASILTSARVTLAPTVTNSADTSVTWSVNSIANGNTAVGQICQQASSPCVAPTGAGSASVDYLAPATVTTVNPVTVTASSEADPTKSGSALIAISAPGSNVAVTVSPLYAFLPPSGGAISTQQFFAVVTGTTDHAVTWSVQSGVAGQGCAGTACGAINGAGLYTSPTSAPSPNAVTVLASSAADASKTASATVAITSGPTIEIILPSSVFAGAVESFPLAVQGAGFVAGSGVGASTILINGTARGTTCAAATSCATGLNPADVASAATSTVQVQNPGPNGALSNPVPFVIIPFDISVGTLALSSGAPAATSIVLVVPEPTTAAESAPIDVDTIGLLSDGSCGIQGSPLTVTRPASGTAVVSLCIHGNLLDPTFVYEFSGAGGAPDGSDIGVTASAITGLFPNMIELDLQISSATLPGVRTLFITTLNNDRAASTGMLEVR